MECALLLLTYCFETLKTVRVQFKTDENNIRSRKAILKTGQSLKASCVTIWCAITALKETQLTSASLTMSGKKLS
jgi:hypothetical protein